MKYHKKAHFIDSMKEHVAEVSFNKNKKKVEFNTRGIVEVPVV